MCRAVFVVTAILGAGAACGGAAKPTGVPATSAGDGAVDVADVAEAGVEADAGARASSRYDWVGVIGTGQSLAVGSGGRPPLSTTQPFHNLKLTSPGPMPAHPLDEGLNPTLVPLVEPIRPYGHIRGTSFQYPNNIFGETPHSAMANQLSAIAL